MTMNEIIPTGETPNGFCLEQNQVEPEVWANIQHWLTSDMLPCSCSASPAGEQSSTRVPIPWEMGAQSRRVAQFGSCRYNYTADVVEHCPDGVLPPIPQYIRQTLLGGVENAEQYTQCIINMYEPENIIPWHTDHSYFGPKVLVYVFGECRPLLLRRLGEAGDEAGETTEQNEKKNVYVHTRAFPGHCSKYILSGDARHVWEHSVDSGNGKRVSITFRSWVGPTVGITDACD